MSNIRRPALRWISAAFLLLLMVLPALPAAAQDAGPDAPAASTVYVPLISGNANSAVTAASSAQPIRSAANIESYWTAERRAAAQPLAAFVAMGPLPEPGAAPEADEFAGLLGYSPSGAPNPAALETARVEFAAEWAAGEAALAADAAKAAGGLPEEITPAALKGSAGIYNTYPGNYWSQFWKAFPYHAVGKLYFRTWYGSDAYCSASVISPRNILVTAAHCVFDTDYDRWHDDFLFVPAARYSTRPYGSFAFLDAIIPTAYVNAGFYAAGIPYDVALVPVGNNSAGRPVTYYTGYLGRLWNLAYVMMRTGIGYPSNISSNYTSVNTAESYYYANEIMGFGTNTGPGSSGMPMISIFRPFDSGPKNYVYGVLSGGPNTPNPTWAVNARFNDSNIKLLCDAVGC